MVKTLEMQNIKFSEDPFKELNQTIKEISPSSVVVVTDENVRPLLGSEVSWPIIQVPAGEESKSIEQVTRIWEFLQQQGVNRNSLVVNIGGGMVSDLGGFAASTYKRGIKTVNIPTTLLSVVDASVGGKTAINFSGIKNDIGTFHVPECVIISDKFYKETPAEVFLSGYGEVLKHGILSSTAMVKSLYQDPMKLSFEQVKQSVEVKRSVVERDPTEQGERKILNLGHTAGHAYEELSPGMLPHGFAVAYGLLTTLVLSHIKLGFPSAELYPHAEFLKDYFMPVHEFEVSCNDYQRLWELMCHDKKNLTQGEVRFVLLKNFGEPIYDQVIDQEEAAKGIDITRDLLGI